MITRAISLIAAILFALPAMGQNSVPWLTRQFDNQRSGWNNQETLLNQTNLTNIGIVRSNIIPLAGDARGMEAQPLIVPSVLVPCRLVTEYDCTVVSKDVMILPSMANVVRGVDAHFGTAIWQVTLGTPVNGSKAIDGWSINQYWGALSTGVVDPNTNRFYQVFWMSPDGTGNYATARYYMAVLNVADGSSVVPPVEISGTAQDINFFSTPRKARSSAVLINQNGTRTVLQCTGTVSESGNGADGFCFAFDTYTNSVTTMVATTAGEGAGIWMGGSGLSCDPQGTYCYAITGNGDFDGLTQWGESFIQLKYTPPTAATPKGASLVITKGWSPWSDLIRSGQAQVPPGKLSGQSLPSEGTKRPVGSGMMHVDLSDARLEPHIDEQGNLVTLVYPNMASGNWSDEDWGSAGPACIFQIGICVATGKDGIGYPINVPNVPSSTTASFANEAANCALLGAYPVWLTMSPGKDISPCPANPTALNFFPNGDTAHLHMTPVQMYDPVLNSWVIFVWGENSQLHKWAIAPTGLAHTWPYKLTYIAESNEYASADVRGRPTGGMPGGFCSGSSDGQTVATYLLACTIPYGNANTTVTQGRFLVYDPIHLDATGHLKVLWDSQRWGVAFLFNKFDPPVIDGGQIYVPNYNGGVDVYSLTNAQQAIRSGELSEYSSPGLDQEMVEPTQPDEPPVRHRFHFMPTQYVQGPFNTLLEAPLITFNEYGLQYVIMADEPNSLKCPPDEWGEPFGLVPMSQYCCSFTDPSPGVWQ